MSIGRQSLDDFVAALRDRTPTPGGGAAAAVVGRLGAALFGMVLRYSRDRKGVDAELAPVLETVDSSVDDLVQRLGSLADEDAEAYGAVRAARALPKGNESELEERARTIQAASLTASEVPLRTLRLCTNGLEMVVALRDRLSPRLEPDTQSAVWMLGAGARAASASVRANLAGLEPGARSRIEGQLDALLPRVEELVRSGMGTEEPEACSN